MVQNINRYNNFLLTYGIMCTVNNIIYSIYI